MNSSVSEYDFDEEGLLMSENLTIETNAIEYHNRGLQAIVLLSLYVLAVWVPEICFVLYSFLVRGVSSNDLIYALFIMITFMASPDAVLIQWEALIFTFTLLTVVVFVWPESLKGKTWCAGLVLLLHGVIGGYLIYLRTR